MINRYFAYLTVDKGSGRSASLFVPRDGFISTPEAVSFAWKLIDDGFDFVVFPPPGDEYPFSGLPRSVLRKGNIVVVSWDPDPSIIYWEPGRRSDGM